LTCFTIFKFRSVSIIQLFDKGHYKIWTLDSGLDRRLDPGLKNGLDIRTWILIARVRVTPNYSAAMFGR